MEFDTKTPPCMTSDPTSFGYVSARERWPVILTGVIDDLHRTLMETTDPAKAAEGKQIISRVVALKYEVQHDRELTPLDDDGESDVAAYNAELAARAPLTWCAAPWLFAECYLYRRLHIPFHTSTHWRLYDPFARQKTATFRSSRPAVLELAAKYRELMAQIERAAAARRTPQNNGNPPLPGEQDEEAERALFTEMCEICLWGNATDLSLLTSLTYADLQRLQGAAARKRAERNVLVNDLPRAFAALAAARKRGGERRVDLVLDNAGFELFVDLVLAGYLLASGLATTVVLHPKAMPWFVSDVLVQDVGALFDALRAPGEFFAAKEAGEEGLKGEEGAAPLGEKEVAELGFLAAQWARFHAEGNLIIRPSRFWTEGGSYWRLPHDAPELYDDLKHSELVILKGDLNYRKLTGDASWDPTTPFTTAIGPLGPGSGLRLLALRTCKADVVVGLPAGKDEELKAQEGGSDASGRARKWAWSGKWAVVSFSDGKAVQ